MLEKGSWAERLSKANKEGKLKELSEEADKAFRKENSVPSPQEMMTAKEKEILRKKQNYNPDEHITSKYQERLEAEEDSEL